MKKSRQEKILSLVRENVVTTQDELIDLLTKSGYKVTQATISRDIKELRLIKTADKSGNQRYIAMGDDNKTTPKYDYIFSSSVISIASSMNDIVIKCYPGMANAACAVLDSMSFKEILGTLAGDDTIFVIAKSEKDAVVLLEKINSLK